MSIDTDSIKASTDLVEIVERDTRLRKVAQTGGGEYAGPCPLCGGRDRFHVQGQGRWMCRKCHPKWDDAIEYVRWRYGVGFGEAYRRLAGRDLDGRGRLPHAKETARKRQSSEAAGSPRALALPQEPPPAAWQERGRSFIRGSQQQLWVEDGALTYLREERGLNDESIRAAGLGYWPQEEHEDPRHWGLGNGKPLWLPVGWVIACEVGGTLWYIKVRRAEGEPKYVAIRGSKQAGVLFGADDLGQHGDLILCEGEFDALLLRQCVGALVSVATLGSASERPGDQAKAAMARFRRIWAAYDQDLAGSRAAEALSRLGPRVRPLRLPDRANVKDITDFWRNGGDLCAWVVGAIGPREPEARGTWAEYYLQRLPEAGLDGLYSALLREHEAAYDEAGNGATSGVE